MRASIGVVVTTLATGCGRSPTEPTESVWDGRVRVAGFIKAFQTNAAVAGARVVVGDATATTDAIGFYSLTIPPGDYQVVVNEESLNIVSMKDRTYRGDFYVQVTGCIARYGTVLDKWSRRPVAGAIVSVGGGRGTTDQTGWYQVTLGCPGTACIGFNTTFLSITHPSYLDGSFVAGRGVCFVSRRDYELEPR